MVTAVVTVDLTMTNFNKLGTGILWQLGAVYNTFEVQARSRGRSNGWRWRWRPGRHVASPVVTVDLPMTNFDELGAEILITATGSFV